MLVAVVVGGFFVFCGREGGGGGGGILCMFVLLRQSKCENAAVVEQRVITCRQRTCAVCAFRFCE